MTEKEKSPSLGMKLRALAAGHGNPVAVKAYVLIFTLCITAFFGTLVAGLHEALEPKRLENEKVSEQRVILSLLGVVKNAEVLSSADIIAAFRDKVKAVVSAEHTMVAPGGKRVEYVFYVPAGGDAGRYVLPIYGQGFWGPIYGWLALDKKSGRILGIDFTRHEETPGLGGRISDKEFKDGLIGKMLKPGKDGKALTLVKGGAKNPDYEADAITGATGTSDAVQKLLGESYALFVQVLADETANKNAGGKK